MDILIFLLVLSILVFVHELGHFLMARRAGIKVEEFGFGFPPRVWGKKIGETIYSINLFPIGGFVRLYGEDDEVKEEREKAFYYKGRFIRTSVIVAGVLMNLLLAVVAFSIISWVVGVPRETGQVKIIGIAKDSPAQKAGLQEEDIVLSVDGQTFSQTKGFIAPATNLFIESINKKKGEEIVLLIKRQESEFAISLVPRKEPPQGEGALGVAVSSSELVHPPLWQRPFVSIWEGGNEAVFWVKAIAVGVSQMASSLVAGRAPEGIAGPIGIFQITSHAASLGVLSLISFVGILSINLAILNILPIPALDGGRLLFIIVEAIFGRRILPTFERYAHTAGMIILLILILLVTFQDITRLLNGGFNFSQTSP